MGWTGTYDRSRDESDREFFSREFKPCEVLQCSKHGNTVYLKLRRESKGKTIVFAMVCLTSWRDGMFYYKDMDETCGPCEVAGCPLSILDGLDEPASEYAANWRQRVRDWHANRNKCKLKAGQRVRFSTPIRFSDGRTHDEFTVGTHRGRRIFLSNDGQAYRITNVADRAFQVF